MARATVMARIPKQLRSTTRLFEIDRLKERLKPDPREHLAIVDALIAGDAAKPRSPSRPTSAAWSTSRWRQCR